jgi:hypothetical protein
MNFDQAVGHALALRPAARQLQAELEHEREHAAALAASAAERKSSSAGRRASSVDSDGTGSSGGAREIAHIQETLQELMGQYASVSENFAALLMTLRLK